MVQFVYTIQIYKSKDYKSNYIKKNGDIFNFINYNYVLTLTLPQIVY